MTKISNQRAYIPDEEINGLDYLPGTDFDQALKTVNFRVQDLGTHYNQVNGLRNFDYNFYAHSGSNPKPADGYFYSNSNNQDPNNITYFVFSKKTARLKDTTNFFESISAENPFDLVIAQKVDINTIFFFRITSIETFSGYYKLNVSEVFFPNGKELSYTLSYAVFNLKSEGISIHNELNGLNEGDYIHLTAAEKEKFNGLPDTFATKTSDLINDGEDGINPFATIQYVTDAIALVPSIESRTIYNRWALTNLNEYYRSRGDYAGFNAETLNNTTFSNVINQTTASLGASFYRTSKSKKISKIYVDGASIAAGITGLKLGVFAFQRATVTHENFSAVNIINLGEFTLTKTSGEVSKSWELTPTNIEIPTNYLLSCVLMKTAGTGSEADIGIDFKFEDYAL